MLKTLAQTFRKVVDREDATVNQSSSERFFYTAQRIRSAYPGSGVENSFLHNRLEARAFTVEEVCDLSLHYGLNLSRAEGLALIQMTAGRPYLVQVTLHHLAKQHLPLKPVLTGCESTTGNQWVF